MGTWTRESCVAGTLEDGQESGGDLGKGDLKGGKRRITKPKNHFFKKRERMKGGEKSPGSKSGLKGGGEANRWPKTKRGGTKEHVFQQITTPERGSENEC